MILSIYNRLGIFFSASYVLMYLILTIILQGRYSLYFHFVDKKAGVEILKN